MIVNLKINVKTMIEQFLIYTTYTLNAKPTRFTYNEREDFIRSLNFYTGIVLPNQKTKSLIITFRENSSSERFELDVNYSKIDVRFILLCLNKESWFSLNDAKYGYFSINESDTENDIDINLLNKISERIRSTFKGNYELEKDKRTAFLDDLKETVIKGLGIPKNLLFSQTPKRIGMGDDIERTTSYLGSGKAMGSLNEDINLKIEKELRMTILKEFNKL